MTNEQANPGRGGAAENHRFWQQSVQREERALTAHTTRSLAHQRGKTASASTPTLRPLGPFGLVQDDAGRGSAVSLPPICEAGRMSGKCTPSRPPRSAGSIAGKAAASFGSRQHGNSRLSTASSARSRLSGTAGLLMFNDGEQRQPPRLPTGSSAWMSSVSSNLRKEVEQAVQEEVAKAVRPIAERLESERAARMRAEALLENSASPTPAC